MAFDQLVHVEQDVGGVGRRKSGASPEETALSVIVAPGVAVVVDAQAGHRPVMGVAGGHVQGSLATLVVVEGLVGDLDHEEHIGRGPAR